MPGYFHTLREQAEMTDPTLLASFQAQPFGTVGEGLQGQDVVG